MKRLNVPSSVARIAKLLIAQAESTCDIDPGMCENAAMVYVGDIYSLREGVHAVNDDSWGERCYNCPPDKDPL